MKNVLVLTGAWADRTSHCEKNRNWNENRCIRQKCF